jgi:hypothetical protein
METRGSLWLLTGMCIAAASVGTLDQARAQSAPAAPASASAAGSASAPAPVASAPAAPPAAPAASAPPAAPAPASSAAAPVASAAPLAAPEPPSTAKVTLYVDADEAWLETRSLLEPGPWRRVCRAPCQRPVVVDGMEARVSGPGMTTSNPFRIEAGPGAAKIRVDAGSRSSRTYGLAGIIGGLPVAMAGLFLYGYGKGREDADLRTTGLVTLAVGAAATLVALPLLAFGSTTVRDGRGDVIARTHPVPRM